MKLTHLMPAAFLVAMIAASVSSAAEQNTKFSKENKPTCEGHEYDVTVEIPDDSLPFKLIVAPGNAPNLGWIQAATFLGKGERTRTIFLGTKAPATEAYEIHIAVYPKGTKVPKEGRIDLNDLEELGFTEVVDTLKVKRTR